MKDVEQSKISTHVSQGYLDNKGCFRYIFSEQVVKYINRTTNELGELFSDTDCLIEEVINKIYEESTLLDDLIMGKPDLLKKVDISMRNYITRTITKKEGGQGRHSEWYKNREKNPKK